MSEQAITISSTAIEIRAQFFVHKDYSVTGKDLILDALSRDYSGQPITVYFWDGENIDFTGFRTFLLGVCDQLDIPYHTVTIHTHDPRSQHPFNTEHLKLGIFVSVGQHLPAEFDQDRTQARFVGSLLGRYNMTRLRLAYELDRAFPNDNYVTFQPRPEFVNQHLAHVSDLYQKELSWLATKQFDTDLVSTHHMGMIDWYAACRNYGQVWNRYHIEVVSETDTIDNFWFTEKTANCLATGKPFVLVSGRGSLKQLQDMGFETFGNIIDESYDLERTPYDRIIRLTHSLDRVYNSPERSSIIDRLYQQAAKNIELYKQYIWK